MAQSPHKHYSDRAVQTSPHVLEPASSTVLSDSHSQVEETKGSFNLLPTPSHSRQSTVSVERIQSDTGSDQVIHLPYIRIQARTNHGSTPKSQLPYRRPSPCPNNLPTSEQTRTVSLPERFTADAIADQLAQAFLSTPRRASVPTSYQKCATSTSSDMSVSMHDSSTFSIDDAEYARVHVSPRTPDMPHTPSPPSTPDSIEIIENSVHLPEAFLRSNTQASDVRSDYEGWLTWASSPPRPIPALHGPASLPYARCPSGAEGTIIEEQSNVPRLIWGLGGDETKPTSGHSRSASMATTASNNASLNHKRDYSSQHQRPAPAPQGFTPRRQMTKVYEASPQKNTNVPLKMTEDFTALHQRDESVDRTNRMSQMDYARQECQTLLHPELNSNALLAPLKDRTNAGKHIRITSTERKLHDFTSRAVSAGINARLAHVNNAGDISLTRLEEEMEVAFVDHEMKARFDLEDALMLHRKAHKLAALRGGGDDHAQNKLMAYLKATAPTFVPAHLRQMSPLPPHSVSQSALMSHNSQTLQSCIRDPVTERALSANHSQPVCLRPQQHHSLPTPPSSSSPLWSSGFSPYPGDMFFPQTPNAAPSHRRIKNQTPNRYLDPDRLEDLSHQLHRFVHGRVSLDDYENSYSESATEMPSAPTFTQGRRLSVSPPSKSMSQHSSQYFPALPLRLPIPIHLKDLVSSSTPRTALSVPQLGPPPNIPLPSVPAPPLGSQHSKPNTVPIFNTYPSPPSPADKLTSPRDMNLARQRPRSIPLARLIERRLASVPEEEANNSSNSISERSQPRKIDPTQIRSTSSSLALLSRNETISTLMTSAPIPIHLKFNPQSRGADSTLSNESENIQVKLPTTKLKTSNGESQLADANDRGDNKENSSRRKRTRGKKYLMPLDD